MFPRRFVLRRKKFGLASLNGVRQVGGVNAHDQRPEATPARFYAS